ARRRANTNVHYWRKAIVVPFWPFGCPFAEAVIAAGDEMINANGPIPWRAPIPFHVAVEREDFALGANIEVIGVAHSRRDEFDVFAIRIEAEQESAWRLFAGAEAVAIFRARENQIIGVIAMRGSRREIGGEFYEIAVDVIEL